MLSALTQGALVKATLLHSQGKKAVLGDSLLAGLRAALPLIGLSFLLALGVGAGFLLLIVPGIVLFVIWSVSAPALVAEKTGVIGAFGRSRTLTRGARWTVFGLLVILVVSSWIMASISGVLMLTSFAAGGMQGFTAAATGGFPLWLLAINGLIQTVTAAVWATMQTSLYVELRNAKDGPPTEALADIFA